MKFSIITVSYNSAETIVDTLRSVVEQTYPHIEYIVVDGNSNDGTRNIIACHGGYINKYVSEPDNGIYEAMNKGIALSTGDVISFLNADDVYSNKNIISKIATLMERDRLDAIYGDVAFFRSTKPGLTVRRYTSKKFSPQNIAKGWMPAHPTLFLKRNIFQRFGFFNTSYKIAGDFEFVARVFYGNSLNYKYLPEVIVRMRTGGISTGGWRNSIQLNREVLQACHENGIHTNVGWLLLKYKDKLLELLSK